MIKAFILSWVVIFSLAGIIYLATYHGYPITNIHTSARIAAGVFLLMVLINAVVEFGWLGGDPNK